MPKYNIDIAQWGLVSGIRQDQSDLVVVHPAPSRFSPHARKGQLLVVAEAAGDVAGGREACALVTQTIQETYYESAAGSITSALRRAMHAANAALYQYNFDAPAHKRSAIGVSSAVFHGSDLYLAQVPPTQAFVAHAGKLRVLPNPAGWGGGTQGGALFSIGGALGTSLGSEPEFFRSVLQPGDAVVLCSSNLVRLLSKHQAEELICFADAATVSESLLALCRRANLPEAHAAVIEIMPALSAEAQHAPLSVAGVSERGKLAASKVGDWIGEMATEAQLAVQPKPLGGEAGPSASATEPAGATAVVEAAPAGQALLEIVPIGDADMLPASAFLGEGEYGGVVRPPSPKREHRIDLGDNTGTPIDFMALPRRVPQPPPSVLRSMTLPFRRALIGVLSGVANTGRRTRRSPIEAPRPAPKVRGLSYRRTRPAFPWLNIGVLLLLLVLLVFGGLHANRRRDNNTATRAIVAVEQAIAAARGATDDTSAQEQLRLAEANLKKIDPLLSSGLITTTKSTWPAYQQVLQDYDRAMAQINQIGFFDSFTTVATLPNPQSTIARLVLGVDATVPTRTLSETLYLLDSASGTVFAGGAGGTRSILGPGTEIGGVQVNKITDLVWRIDQPMALERNQDPFNPFITAYLGGEGDWFVNKLPGSELLPSGDPPLATYGGNLYVWNADAQRLFGEDKQIMKYAAGLYADLPERWITSPGPGDVSDVTSMIVDGTVYLLHGDGSVSVYQGNAFQKMLPAPAMAVPLVEARRFYVAPDLIDATGNVERTGHIYILDLQNERIVQIDKATGALIQQMQARSRGPLNQLTDLHVDETNNLIYLANGSRVLRAALPTPPEAEAEASPAPDATSTPSPGASP